jgi:hypothetical protein
MEEYPIPVKDEVWYVRCRQDERRAQPRLPCKGVAEIWILHNEDKIEGTLLDLSVAGCCIETKVAIPAIENPCVEVRLCVKGFTLRIAGVVRNIKKDMRAGIEFIDVTERKAAQIRELITDLIEMEKNRRAHAAEMQEEAADA